MALIAWYPLDGNTEDYTVNQNHGTATNVSWVNGKIGQAGSFNGTSSQIVSGQNLGLSGNPEFSIAYWVYYNGISWTSDYPSIFGNNTTFIGNSGLSTTWRGGRPALDFWDLRYRVTTPLLIQKWYHVTFTKKQGILNGNTKIYIDGVLVAGAVEGTDTTPSIIDSIVVIGRLNAVAGRYWNGLVNDIRIYDHALSQKEINDLVKAKVLHYTFNKDEDIIYDNSGYKRNGIKSGNPTISASISKLGNGSLQMNGSSQYVDTNFGLGYNPATNPISFSLWVKTNDPSASDMYLATSNGSSQRFYIAQYGGYWDIGIATSAWLIPGSGVSVTTEWTHLALVMNGSSAKLYVNGILSQTKSYSSYIFNRNIWIGHNGTVSYTPNGNIDDVRIYATPLSDVDILDLYQTRIKLDNQGNLYANEFVEDYEVASGLTLTQLFEANNRLYNINIINNTTYYALTSSISFIQNNYYYYANRQKIEATTVSGAAGTVGSYVDGSAFKILDTNLSLFVSGNWVDRSTIYQYTVETLTRTLYYYSSSSTPRSLYIKDHALINLTSLVNQSYFQSIPTISQMNKWHKDYYDSRTNSNGQVISREFSEIDSPNEPMKIFKDKIQIQGSIKEG